MKLRTAAKLFKLIVDNKNEPSKPPLIFETYAPQTPSEMFDQSAVRQLTKFLTPRSSQSDYQVSSQLSMTSSLSDTPAPRKQVCLIHGTYGTGKRLLLSTVTQSMGLQTLRINTATHVRTAANLQKIVGEATQSKRIKLAKTK